MKKTLRRLFCLLLCAVTVVGLLPAAAFAAQTGKETAEYEETTVTTEMDGYLVDVAENGIQKYTPTTFQKQQTVLAPVTEEENSFAAKKAITEYDWSIDFTTFADLQELAARTYSEWTYVYYEGDEALEITDSLTLPHNLDLYISNDQDLIIPAGVTLTVTSDLQVYGDLTVEGTLILNRSAYFEGDVTVTGTVQAYSNIRLECGNDFYGMDNVQFINEWSGFVYDYEAETFAELKEAVALATANSGNEYQIYLYPEEDIVISSDLTFPENARFYSWCDNTITVNAGVTLTFNCYASISSPMVIKGKLVNNEYFSYQGYGSGHALQFTSTGSYAGNGYLLIHVNDDDTDYTPYLTGLDVSNFDIVEYDNGEYSHYWQLRDTTGLTRLSAPTNLGWNKALNYYWNEETESWYSKWETFYGYIRFKGGEVLDEGNEYTMYNIKLYKDGELYYQTGFGYSNDYLAEGNYMSTYLAAQTDFETGDYYFTVQAVAMSTDYLDSEVVTSSTFSYTKPSGRYARPTGAKWVDGPSAQWTSGYDDLMAKIELYYAATADAEPELMSWSWGNMIGYEIDKWDFESWGTGYYYFKVRNLSDNIKTKYHSAWTAMSSAYNYTGKNKPVAPTIKSSIDAASGKPYIYWERSPGANKYRIYRATSKTGTYSSIDVIETDYTEFYYYYTDTTANAGTKYYYKVRAYSYTDVASSLSNIVTRMCDLARPTVSITGSASSGKPIVKWNTVSGAEKYEIYRATSKSGTYKLVKTAISARSYEDTTAKVGTNYYYKVKAIHEDSDANSAFSKIVNRMCDLKRPVVNISLTSAGNPYLKWTAISGAEKYYVYRATSKSGTYKYLGSTTSAKYVDKDVTEGKTYYYKVKAIHAKSGANSAYSAIDYITAE